MIKFLYMNGTNARQRGKEIDLLRVIFHGCFCLYVQLTIYLPKNSLRNTKTGLMIDLVNTLITRLPCVVLKSAGNVQLSHL